MTHLRCVMKPKIQSFVGRARLAGGHAFVVCVNYLVFLNSSIVASHARGEQYPCKPDVFWKTYEPVGD